MDESVALALGESTTAEVILSGGRRVTVSVVPLFMAEALSRRRLLAEGITKPEWPTITEETLDGLGQEKAMEWADTPQEFKDKFRQWKERDAYWFEIAVTILALPNIELPKDDGWLDTSGAARLGLEVPEDPVEKLYWYIRATVLLTPADSQLASRTARELSIPSEKMVEEEVTGFFSRITGSLFRKRIPT